MTTATLEEVEEELALNTPRRVVLITVGVLLPAEFNDADIADIMPTSIAVTGAVDGELTDFIQTRVQEARLVMT